MKISHEREGFKLRLQQALKNAEYAPDISTELAREFNARFEGRAVTVSGRQYEALFRRRAHAQGHGRSDQQACAHKPDGIARIDPTM